MDGLLSRAWRQAGGAEAPRPPVRRALVLSGGVALGAFEAGAYAALEEAGAPLPEWIVGASIGAVNAAIIAGNPPGLRVERLRRLWASLARDPMPVTSFLFGQPPATGAWRKLHNEASGLQTLLFGRPGLFRPKPALLVEKGAAPGLYDLGPLRERLPELLDFERLNSGGMRLSVAATDIGSGERVVFDAARGDRIGPEHIAASSALLPLIAPVVLGGRLFGDGGLATNTPIDLVLDEPGDGDLLCFAVELFAMEGGLPQSLGATVSRAAEIAFGNQTRRMVEGREREHRLRALVQRLAEALPPERREDPDVASILAEAESHGARSATVVRVTHRASPDEAHPGGSFDFSPATLAERWEAGAHGMREALRRLEAEPVEGGKSGGLIVHDVGG
ncbi:MAG: Ferredoxin reductase [uncultured Acetobacteraceae bacterium]|uniref:Ferredoxin reductase n=1 Tax=uncultured Acetobacteraceae bacterium TaxID=169975 RepID=A0A6J4HVJ5_9PROT|nr:MAG: Ferredoxin reductase [uncultured Acetobacteraceae bacterium]